MLSGAVLALVTANPALGQAADALPTEGTVVAGLATIGTPSPSAKLDITQTSIRAVIDWTSFDIGQNAEVAFTQPGTTSIALNRVTGGTAPSQIAGKLTANGMVAVLNANGVVFAGTADVDVGGLIVATGQMDTTAFMAGGNVLGVTGASGGEIVVSAGADITVANAGLAAFVAPNVRNSGTITATAGRVQLGAGTAFTLDLASDGLLQIGVGANSPLVQNHGGVFATGGQIQLSARQASALLDQTIRTGVLPVGTARLEGSTIVLDATGNNVQIASEIAGQGNLVLSGSRIFGAADVNIDGNLTLNVNAGGAVADTLAGGNNWINDALGVIGAQVDATTINLGAGLYRPGTVINASNVTLDGQGVARIGWVSGIENAIDVWGDNVTVRKLEIFGPATSAYTSFAWGSTNSRGVFVNRFADNVTVTNNNIHDIRTGIIVDGRNLNALVTGNRLDNTKSGISVQYTNGGDALTSGIAGSSITLAGNFEGAIGNEWGINVHLNGIWNGGAGNPGPSTSLVGGLPVGILGTASFIEQQRLVALGAANNGMSVQNIAYSAANRTRAYVTPTGGGSNVQGSQLTPFASIQNAVNAVVTGGTVRIANGTYNIGNSPILIRRGLSLIGASQAGVIIDGRGVGAGLGTMQVQADNVTLSNFTLYGADSGVNNYGIKVQPNSSGGAYSPNQRLLNFAISDVTVRGSTRAELDLNGVVGATITNVTADGRRVTNDAFQSAGAGVQITDSSNVTLTGVHTLGNAWGGVALYQANKSNAYNGQTTNITIDAAANQFDEANGLFSQLESTTQGFGQLNLTGFNYAVRNTDHRPDDLDAQFIFYRTSLTDAVAFAKSVGTASAGSIEGYTGTALSNVFTVAEGLTIASALRDVRTGGTVNVGAGTFAETVSIGKSLTFAGAGMDATSITGGMLLSGSLNDLVLRDFTMSGSGGTAVIGNSGTITGLTVEGVRIDGLNVANRHGFTGGQIGGAISITDSEFVNIRGWSAFDTRSGTSGDNGSQITRGVFSNNLIDNTIGHIAFRQQIGAASLPDIVISGNTVRNVGSATNSFGATFKAFNADTVDFTGNNVSGVGTSGFNPAGEVPYGAVLMTRGTAVLNVTGNTFTDNNQVFAVEPGRALPGVSNFSGNTFVNNGYSIYLPANLSGAGTIQFGSGNSFSAGANTVQHILWRSASGLDLTGVSFDGTLASELSLDEAFAVEDLITHGVDLAGVGLARVMGGELFVTSGSGSDAVLRAAALGTSGDTLNLSGGTHTLTDTLFLTQDIDLAGQGIGATILDATGHDSYGIRVHADNVALGGFTLNGSAAATNSTYGIKVESGGGANERNTGFSIANVAIAGSHQTGLDLDSAVGALIDGVSVTASAAGSGIAIADSANVVVRNSSTSGNALGGLALRQSNGNGHQDLDQVTVEANNAFGEANGVSLQAGSALTGAVSVLGYGYTVRNGDQFTYFQKTAQNAFDYAVNLASPGASVVQGWTGSADDHSFHVGHGALTGGGQQALLLQAAFGASANGDTINIASGNYAENATLSGTRALNFGDVVLNGLTLAATTAGNTFKGNLTLAGGNLTAAGPLTLTGATAISAASGHISLGSVSGAQALTLSGNGITLGATNLASLAATGTTIATSGVSTIGAQSYTGAAILAGDYEASDFVVNGATMLGSDTLVTASGAARFGSIDGAVDFSLEARSATLGAVGQDILIAAMAVTADETVLTAGTYRANSMRFAGGDGATVQLTQVKTIFDSTSGGGPIEIASHLIGTEPGQQNVAFVTGSGVADDGTIALGNVGTNAVRIGDLSVTGGDFSAATVKLAGDFTSFLGGSQVFSSQTLDTLGNVKAQVAGSESGPIVAGGAVSVVAGGSGTGSIVAGGPVELAYSNEVSRAISSLASVSLAATGPVTGSITATGAVAVSAAGPVSATVKTDNSATIASISGVSSNVTAGGGVQLTATQGTVSSQVTSGGTVKVDSAGAVTGSIVATGPVAVSATGPVSAAVKTDNSATIASVAGVSSNVTAGGGVQLTATQGAVSSLVNSGGTVSVNATGAVSGLITATGPVAVSASGPVSAAVNTGNSVNITSATEVSSNVTAGGAVQVAATQGAVSGSIRAGGEVSVAAAGPVSAAVSTTGGATIASGSGVSSAVTAGGGVTVSTTQGAVSGSISAGGAVAVMAQGPVSAAVSTTGSANLVSTSGGVSSTINAGGPVAVEAPGPVTSTITSGSTVQLTSDTPINVQVTGGAVSVNAPGGQVTGLFAEIITDKDGTFVVNDQPVVGNGIGDARQILVDSFLAPVGGTVGPSGEAPNGLVAAVSAPSGAAGRGTVLVGSVDSLGDLLRRGYTAIVIDIGASGLELESEDSGN